MVDKGFDVPESVQPRSFQSARDPMSPIDVTPFEAASIQSVAQRGYAAGGPEASTAEPIDELSADPLTQWIRALPEERQTAYQIADLGDGSDPITIEGDKIVMSIPGNGCEFESLRAVYGDVDAYAQLLAELNDFSLTFHGAVRSHPEYLKSVDAWRICLRDAGYEATVPDDMPSADRSNDVDLAIADRRCRDDSDLVGARRNAILATANDHKNQLEQLHDRMTSMIDDADRRALEIVDGS